MARQLTWSEIAAPMKPILLLASLGAIIFALHPSSQDFVSRRLGEDEEEGLEATVVLLFMFFGLAIGILAMQGLSLVGEPIPYTCLVFLLGVIFSLGNNNHDGTFGKSIGQWVDIDADLLLFVFLPPLIFGEAMSLNWYHVRGAFLQSVILAGPGVLIGAALMGAITKVILPYNWSWTLSMVFGSILSATDPVAVVALLKSVGASPKLTILIVGESLLNDGSAMVLFTLFFNSLNGTHYTAGSIISFFFSAAFGSVLLGIGFGLVTVRWLRSANRPLKEIDVTTQIAITICCAYLCFFTAQYALKISGVLACCGAGAMLAWLAPPVILNHESMHNVWSMIEWSLNTLIFLLAGLIIGNRVLSKVNTIDWAYLILLYILLLVIRFITIFLLYPSIAHIGHKCSVNEAIFMSWAGLRGALGMALALIVEKYCPDNIKDETSRMFFYVGGIAALTLVFNATTAKTLLFKLGLLGTNSAEKQLVTDQIKKKLRKKMDKVIEQMTKDAGFEDPRQDRISRLLSRGHRGTSSIIDDDLLQYIRAVFLEIVRVKYWHFIEVGKLPRLSHSAQFLLYTIEVGLDEVKEAGGARDWYCLEEELDYKSYAVFFLTLWENYTPLCLSQKATDMLGRIESRNEKRFVYMLTSFIEAHEHAQKKIHAFLGLEDEEVEAATPEELQVIAESKVAVERAKARLHHMNGETINAIRSKQAARLVLAKEAEMVKAMVQEGLLTSHHAEEFLEEISHDTQRIEKERNRMYQEHAKKKGKIRTQRKQEEFESRPSLFSPFTKSFTSRESAMQVTAPIPYRHLSGADLDNPLLDAAAMEDQQQQSRSSAAAAVFSAIDDDDEDD
eukprot:gene4262-3041_t